MKTTEENNRLIAEFMGYKVDFGFDKKGVLFAGQHIGLDKLIYHTSWDWLMPVYYKIQDTVGETSNIFNEFFNSITMFNSIDFLYQAVVQFIEWYNENK